MHGNWLQDSRLFSHWKLVRGAKGVPVSSNGKHIKGAHSSPMQPFYDSRDKGRPSLTVVFDGWSWCNGFDQVSVRFWHVILEESSRLIYRCEIKFKNQLKYCGQDFKMTAWHLHWYCIDNMLESIGLITWLSMPRSSVQDPEWQWCPLARYWSTFATPNPGEKWTPGRVKKDDVVGICLKGGQMAEIPRKVHILCARMNLIIRLMFVQGLPTFLPNDVYIEIITSEKA